MITHLRLKIFFLKKSSVSSKKGSHNAIWYVKIWRRKILTALFSKKISLELSSTPKFSLPFSIIQNNLSSRNSHPLHGMNLLLLSETDRGINIFREAERRGFIFYLVFSILGYQKIKSGVSKGSCEMVGGKVGVTGVGRERQRACIVLQGFCSTFSEKKKTFRQKATDIEKYFWLSSL